MALWEKVIRVRFLFIGNEVFVIDSLPFKKKKKYSLNKHEQILQSGKEFEFTEMWNMTEKIDRWIEHLDDDALFTGNCGFYRRRSLYRAI